MSEPIKHLSLFPAELPKDQLVIIFNGIRGVVDGRTNRDRVEAAWWVLGYGLSFIPDAHPATMAAAPMTGEELASALESVASEQKLGLIPWDRIVTKLWELILAWLANQ